MMPSLIPEDTVQIILLVLESKSRRFELLQLEFDRNALVQEILAQIPDAATEDVLRRQSYAGICSADGEAMAPEAKLGDCIKFQNEVKVAIPSGLSAKDCATVAAPILNDEKVKAMLAEASADAEEIAPSTESREKKKPKKAKKSKSKDEKDKPKKKKKSSRSVDEDEDTAETTNGTSHTETRSASPSSSESKLMAAIKSFFGTFLIPIDYTQTIGKHKVVHVTALYAFLGFFISIICTEVHLTMPLRPGSIMHSGDFIRKCGWFSVFRGNIFGCSEMSAVMDDDSFLNVYEVNPLYPVYGKRTLVYRIVPENSAGMTDDGLYVDEDGSITIGGKEIVIEVANEKRLKGQPKLSPWPFMNEVNLIKRRKNLLGRVVYKPV